MDHDTTPLQAHASTRRSPDKVRVRIKSPWTAVPNVLLQDQRISRDARLLGCLMFLHAGNKEKAFPSQEMLAAEMSHWVIEVIKDDVTGEKREVETLREITIRSIQRWLTELKKAGWLDWRQTTRNNQYTLLEPEETLPLSVVSIEHSDSSNLNGNLMGATAVSSSFTASHDPAAAIILTGATAVSSSTTTQGSPPTTQGSPQATQGSPSPIYRDLLVLDSSSSDAPSTQYTDGDGDAFVLQRRNGRAKTPDTQHTETSAWLGERGINAAKEFRHLPLGEIQRVYGDIKQRQPDATPGTITNALRAYAARRAIEVAQKAQDAQEVARAIGDVPPLAAPDAVPLALGPAPTDPTALWSLVLDDLRVQVPRTTFDATLRPATLVGLTGDVATVAVPSRQAKEQIEDYTGAIRAALSEAAGRTVQVRVVIAAKGR